MTTTETKLTLKQTIADYMTEINASDKTECTKKTFANCLGLMQKFFGDDKEVDKLLTVHMANYFKSESVMGTAEKPKAKPTSDQIKRITRMMLCWAEDKGYIVNLPLTKEEKAISIKKEAAQVKKAIKEERKAERLAKKAEKKETVKKVAEPDKPKEEYTGPEKTWIIGEEQKDEHTKTEPAVEPEPSIETK